MAIFVLVFLAGFALFNVGSVTPTTGTGELTQGRPSLQIKGLLPLTVAGRDFRPAERVRLSGAGTKTVTATRGGKFTVRMGRAPCGGFTLVARGSAGSRATLDFSNVSNIHCLD